MAVDEVKDGMQQRAPVHDSGIRYVDHLKELKEIAYRTGMRTVGLWCL